MSFSGIAGERVADLLPQFKGLAGTYGGSIALAPATAQRAAALLASLDVAATTPLIGLAPGAAYGHAKRWPPARVAALIARLVTERGAACVLVGAAAQ